MPISSSSTVDRVYFVRSPERLLTAVLYRDPGGTWQLAERIQRFGRVEEKAPDDWVQVRTPGKTMADLRRVRADMSQQAANLAESWGGEVEVLEVNGTGEDYARMMAQRGHIQVISLPISEGPARPQ